MRIGIRILVVLYGAILGAALIGSFHIGIQWERATSGPSQAGSALVTALPMRAPATPSPRIIYTKPTRVMDVSAYCPCELCCGQFSDGITASGLSVEANGGFFVAADKSIPFGTMVSVPGYNDGEPVPVLDRGGAITGNKLDVYFPTHESAIEWGRRNVAVTIGAN